MTRLLNCVGALRGFLPAGVGSGGRTAAAAREGSLSLHSRKLICGIRRRICLDHLEQSERQGQIRVIRVLIDVVEVFKVLDKLLSEPGRKYEVAGMILVHERT